MGQDELVQSAVFVVLDQVFVVYALGVLLGSIRSAVVCVIMLVFHDDLLLGLEMRDLLLQQLITQPQLFDDLVFVCQRFPQGLYFLGQHDAAELLLLQSHFQIDSIIRKVRLIGVFAIRLAKGITVSFESFNLFQFFLDPLL